MVFDPQSLSLLLAVLHLLVKQDGTLYSLVVLGFKILQGRCRIARLSFEVVVLHLDVAELELQRPLRLAEGCDFLLKGVLRIVGLCLALLVFGLAVY